MQVRLISHSRAPIGPEREVEFKDGEIWVKTFPEKNIQDLIAYAARVSNPSNQDNKETADKLLKYLIKHKHWSPFEMASACLEIETTRDIARQILRHRSFSFQEFSQRYADPTKDLEFVTREARLQDKKNRKTFRPPPSKPHLTIALTQDELKNWGKEVSDRERVLDLIKCCHNKIIGIGQIIYVIIYHQQYR